MLDISYIRENVAAVKEAASNKNVTVDIDELLRIDDERKNLQQQLDAVRQQRNEAAAEIGKAPSASDIELGKKLKLEMQNLEHQHDAVHESFIALMEQVPNVPAAEVPIGPDESSNQVIRKVGEPLKMDFPPKGHWDIGTELGLINSETAARVSGSRFSYLMGPLVQVQFALVQHALATVTSQDQLQDIASRANLTVNTKPFIPVLPPVFVRPEVLSKMGRLEPKEDRYHTEADDLYLVGSAEHTLGPLHLKETLSEEDLPVRYIGYSTSFRREAGSHGKDVRGILRQHQFDKLEIESFTTGDASNVEQDFIVAIQEYLMQSLELPYQVVMNATGDMGKPDYRQFDIETWMPGQDTYRETHSSDHMGDFQARRLQTKVRRKEHSEYVHMNDATVFAMGRTLIALLENHQQADGSIRMPAALHPYLPFTSIEK